MVIIWLKWGYMMVIWWLYICHVIIDMWLYHGCEWLWMEYEWTSPDILWYIIWTIQNQQFSCSNHGWMDWNLVKKEQTTSIGRAYLFGGFPWETDGNIMRKPTINQGFNRSWNWYHRRGTQRWIARLGSFCFSRRVESRSQKRKDRSWLVIVYKRIYIYVYVYITIVTGVYIPTFRGL